MTAIDEMRRLADRLVASDPRMHPVVLWDAYAEAMADIRAQQLALAAAGVVPVQREWMP